MKTSIEERLEELGRPPSREGEIIEHCVESVRNPIPSKMDVLDYYVNKSGWQRRYIISMEGNKVGYTYYFLEDLHFGNSGRMVNGKVEYYPINEGYWEYRGTGYCTKAHIRSWSQK